MELLIKMKNPIKAKLDISEKLCAKYETCDKCPVSNNCHADQEYGHNGFYNVIEEVIDCLFEEV